MTTHTHSRSGGRGQPCPITLAFNAAKLAGRGEDADPLLRISKEGAAILGVFDGLGGSGAQRCGGTDGVQTGAYYGARVARQATDDFLKIATQFADVTPAALAAVLVQHLQHDLSAYDAEWGRAASSALRSTVFRRLPTTAAVAVARPAAGELRTTVLWAGDSRCYALSPAYGLQQLTRDHLRTFSDALGNLTTDSSISNCITADAPFTIDSAECSIAAPVILIAATDGCFGYVPSPMHFEALLVASLVSARSVSAWHAGLAARVTAVAGDDASLAAIAIGWSSFRTLRRAFADRLRILQQTYLDPFVAAPETLPALWLAYRATYEALQPKELACVTT